MANRNQIPVQVRVIAWLSLLAVLLICWWIWLHKERP